MLQKSKALNSSKFILCNVRAKIHCANNYSHDVYKPKPTYFGMTQSKEYPWTVNQILQISSCLSGSLMLFFILARQQIHICHPAKQDTTLVKMPLFYLVAKPSELKFVLIITF